MRKRHTRTLYSACGCLVFIFLVVGCARKCVDTDLSRIAASDTRIFIKNGGWCWFQDERAIIHQGKLITGAVAGSGGGDVKIAVFDLEKGLDLGTVILEEKFEQDDHNAPALYARPDDSILAMYARHGKTRDTRHFYRISEPGNPLQWGTVQMFDHGPKNWLTYMNLYYLPADKTLYCFYRDGKSFQPYYMFSEDHGETWQEGGHLISHGLKGRHRPYARYASNGMDRVFISFTEAHPASCKKGCSIYFAAFGQGKFYKADGSVIKDWSKDSPLTPGEADLVFKGDPNNNAWTSSIKLDGNDHPHIGYSVHKSDEDHRYRYAYWDGKAWRDREVAYAGRCLYPGQNHYTGLITLDPQNPEFLYISTNVDPATGQNTGTGKYEIYCGRIGKDQETSPVKWIPVTKNSEEDNIRPVCVAGEGYKALLWLRGSYPNYESYQTDVVGRILRSMNRK